MSAWHLRFYRSVRILHLSLRGSYIVFTLERMRQKQRAIRALMRRSKL